MLNGVQNDDNRESKNSYVYMVLRILTLFIMSRKCTDLLLRDEE